MNSDQGVDPNSINQVAYVCGNPLMSTDPTGMIGWPDWAKDLWDRLTSDEKETAKKLAEKGLDKVLSKVPGGQEAKDLGKWVNGKPSEAIKKTQDDLIKGIDGDSDDVNQQYEDRVRGHVKAAEKTGWQGAGKIAEKIKSFFEKMLGLKKTEAQDNQDMAKPGTALDKGTSDAAGSGVVRSGNEAKGGEAPGDNKDPDAIP